MRLYKYINEQTKKIDDLDWLEHVNKIIHKDCGPYLRVINNREPLLRGMNATEPYGSKRVRKDRKPQGMLMDEFIAFNKWLEERGHNRRDKSFSATSTSHVALFGNPYFVFPIGKFSYTWLKAKDINMPHKPTKWDHNHFTQYLLGRIKEKDTKMKDIESYFVTDRAIKVAIRNGFEIWINCDVYYYVTAEWNGGPLPYYWNDRKQIFEPNEMYEE